MSATVSFTVPSPAAAAHCRSPCPTRARARASRCSCCTASVITGRPGTRWWTSSPTERDVIAVDLPGFGASPALPDGLAYDLPTTTAVFGAFCEAMELDRPHVAGNSLGGLLALELGREKLARSVTALSPAGFWSEAERRYAFGVLLTMRGISRRLPLPLVERLSSTAAGRTALTSTIYARPGRRSPEAVVAETLALARATGFDATLTAGITVGSPTTSPASRSPWPGAPRTGCSCAARACAPSRSSPRPAGAAARLRPLPDERRPGAGRPRHPRRQPLTPTGTRPGKRGGPVQGPHP